MIRPIRIGVQLAPQHATYPELRDAVARFEQLGVDVIVGWDHFFPLTGDPDGAHFESWMTLAAGVSAAPAAAGSGFGLGLGSKPGGPTEEELASLQKFLGR